jgi:hypothetical protein
MTVLRLFRQVVKIEWRDYGAMRAETKRDVTYFGGCGFGKYCFVS